MVSLNGNSRQTGQGGMTFFSDSLSSHHDDDPLLDAGMPYIPRDETMPRWMTQEIKKYRTIGTVKAILLDMFLYICLILSAFLLPHFCGDGQCGHSVQEPTALVLYVHGATWFLLLLTHMYLGREHRSSVLHGYFAFHLRTRCLRKLPLHVSSGANAVLVVVSRILGAVCRPDGSCDVLNKAAYLQIIICLEALVALVGLSVYLVRTLRFNKAKDTPDFLRSSMRNESPKVQNEIGFMGKRRSYKAQKTIAMALMWYEVLYWKHQRVDVCRDILNIQDQLDKFAQE